MLTPLTNEAKAELAQWSAGKAEQWGRFAPEVIDGKLMGLPLQMARHGTELAPEIEGDESPRQRFYSVYTLIWSTDDFYEAIVFGQLPRQWKVPKNPKLRVTKDSDLRDATEAEKPTHARRIDLTDDQIDLVLGAWSKGITALTLPSVVSAWQRNGREYTRPAK